MATQTAASDHASATDQQYVKKEKDEGIAQMIASLANEDEVKHDKPDGDDKSEDTSSNKTEDKVTAELAAVEEEQSAEDTLDHHKVEDAQSSTPTPTEEVDHKVEPAIAVQNTEYSLPPEATIAAEDKLKEEKEVVPASHTISDIEPVHDAANSQPDVAASTELSVEETPPQKLENEAVETDKEKQSQPKTEDIPEASTETIDKTSNTDETDPPTESEGEVVKEAQVLETGAGVEDKLEPVATQVEEKIEEAEKELQEAEQPSTIAVPEQAADAVEEKATEPSEDVVEETANFETGPTETVDAEPLVTKVNENQEEPEKQPLEQREEEKPDTSAIPEQSAERSDAIEEKTRELDFEAEVLKETNNFETEKAEPVGVKVDESQTEPEKLEEEEKSKTVVLEAEAEKVEQQGSTEKVEDTGNSESDTISEKIEKPEPLLIEVEEKPSEQLQVDDEVVEDCKDVETKKEIVIETAKTERTLADLIKEEKADKEEETSLTVNAAQVSANEEPQSNLVEPSTEAVLETSKSEGTSDDTVKEEKTDKEEETGLTGNAAQVSSHEEPLANLVEPSPEVVLQISKSEGTSDDTIKEEKTDKEEETSHTENATQVSSNEEPQANIVEPSPVVAEKVVEEDDNKEPQVDIVKTDKEEEISHTENAAQVSSNDEPQANTVEPSHVVAEKVVEEDDNKEPQANVVKTDKEGETSFTESTAQVSSNEEAQANTVEPSVVAEKIVEEDNNKESSITDVIEGVPNEVAGIIKSPEPASVDQGAEPSLKEEREYSVPADVEEKIAIAANDDEKKEPEAPKAVTGSSTEEEAESRKVEEQNEAKTATTEVAESVKVENVRGDDDSSVVDDKKEGNGETKVEEISRAVSEPVRETLASKFEEKEEEYVEPGVKKLEKEQTVEPEKTEVQVTKESDAIKTSKDLPKETPAKPAQKQSNNIISKVKQSLVKAKKAITGKSPSSKNLSSEAKGDIKVK
ncbi:protein P200 [Vigna umbellata]|uniref:protein P200 n=1 Tax=Vigna umbellata TaxID=87088 RepID=UPI001F5ED904|nr:protein P200 [Vigna umbellata]